MDPNPAGVADPPPLEPVVVRSSVSLLVAVLVGVLVVAVAYGAFVTVAWHLERRDHHRDNERLECIAHGFADVGIGASNALGRQIGPDRRKPLDQIRRGGEVLRDC